MQLKSLARAVIILFIAIQAGTAYSQSTDSLPANDRGEQLDVVQSVLETKLNARAELRAKIPNALPDDVTDIENELTEINIEIAELRDSFEQIAVGSVDLGIFNTQSEEFDWKNEMTQVMMPIIRNMQSLTEKPRKIEALRTQINLANDQLATANDALYAIEQSIAITDQNSTLQSLNTLKESWENTAEDLVRNRDVAKVRLANLQKGDGNFWQSVKSGVVGFIAGRGLTLVLAIAAATGVWYATTYLSKIVLNRKRTQQPKTFRTRQRLVQYGFNIMTGILMLIAVIVVFYTRGDVLLLGVAILFAAAALIGLRNTIPRFIREARLLLNLGSIREDERVVYNGLPYRIISLNMQSVLRNPELTGIIRLPLENMIGMISRPAGNELWFPASKGDFIIMPDGKMLEVLELTTELIHLQNLAGTKTSVPSADFYNMTFDNLSRGENFSIVGTFGVGYSLQDISNNGIPVAFQKAVTNALSETNIAEHVVAVAVELKEAGASSLDYWVCVTLSSAAVRSYYKVSRVIQQACVDTCTKENWDIPFPQLTIHNE